MVVTILFALFSNICSAAITAMWVMPPGLYPLAGSCPDVVCWSWDRGCGGGGGALCCCCKGGSCPGVAGWEFCLDEG
eukprot:12149117-Karenia_brevis.AAC.1